MLPITGYTDRFSARPGETIAFKVDCRNAPTFAASLVRIRSGDPNPDGPGIRETDLSDVFAINCPGVIRDCHLGSYVRVEHPAVLDAMTSFSVTALVWPTTPEKPKQVIVARTNDDGSAGFALVLDGARGITARMGSDAGPVSVTTDMPLDVRQWHRVWSSYNAETRQLEAGQMVLSGDRQGQVTRSEVRVSGTPRTGDCGDLCIAAKNGDPADGHYNGKIENPRIIDAALEVEHLSGTRLPPGVRCLADWDFSVDIPGLRAIDRGPYLLHGRLVNLPARAVTGHNWTGDEPNWRHAPEQYGAIHFHDDDIHDCGWDTDFSFTVPDTLRSGVYGMRLEAGGVTDLIPFFVRPPRGKTTSDICVLIPTFTYVIYANHARGNTSDLYHRRAAEWGARPWTSDDHPEYGLSTYNFHSDGSGICHASSLRPMITYRSAFLSIPELPGSGLRHFSADTHLFDWLEEKGHDFDVITDHDLHEEGVQALSPYPVILTCTHPEYHTDATYDAVRDYVGAGGNLMYLGGNGFYWRIAMHRDTPGVLEIRRGEVGIRAWAAEPGEFFNAFDGTYGGLWRRVGKPPNLVVGVGFSAQGKMESGHYRRLPGSKDERTKWIFDGVDGDIIGDFGLNGEGAAGYELDRADARLGTSTDAVILATSENLPSSYVIVPEDMLSHVATWNGEPVSELLRADMVYFERPGGGRVFSVGSITFCGSLFHNHYNNNVSRIVENVLTEFRRGRERT